MPARRIVGAIAGTAALTVLAAVPAAAALPQLLWLPLCSGGDTHWLAVPLAPDAPKQDDRTHFGCAHVNCPRKMKFGNRMRAD